MSTNIEGTIVLDGLIEGRAPGEESEQRVRQWVQLAQQLGLRFNVSINGSSFSILPDTRPAPAAPLGGKPEKTIADLITQLLQALPPPARPRVFSTLRSAEYRPGEQVQVIYGVTPEGGVEAQTRVVPADTTPPPTPLTTREKLRLAATGLVIALAMLGITAFFVDLRGLYSQLVDTVHPVSASEVHIDTSAFAGIVEITKVVVTNNPTTLVLTTQRGQGFPTTDDDLNQAVKAAGDNVRRRMAYEAVATGYIRCELYDVKGKLMGTSLARVSPLREQPSTEIGVVLPQGQRPGKLVLAL